MESSAWLSREVEEEEEDEEEAGVAPGRNS